MLHFLSLFKLATEKIALKSHDLFLHLFSFSHLSGSVRAGAGAPQSAAVELRWSCGAGVSCSECPASADVYQPNDFREAPTLKTHNRMMDEPKNQLGPSGGSDPAGSEPGVRTGSRSSRTRNITVTTRENTSLVSCD